MRFEGSRVVLAASDGRGQGGIIDLVFGVVDQVFTAEAHGVGIGAEARGLQAGKGDAVGEQMVDVALVCRLEDERRAFVNVIKAYAPAGVKVIVVPIEIIALAPVCQAQVVQFLDGIAGIAGVVGVAQFPQVATRGIAVIDRQEPLAFIIISEIG